jgi:hypothetical protein
MGRWPVAPGRDLQAALEAASRLGEADLLRLYEAIVEQLETEPPTAVQAGRRLDEKVASLRALMEVYEHLGLDASDRLQARVFNAECRAIGSEWNSTRVARAWGRWRVAIDVIGGNAPTDRLGRQAALRATGRRRSGRRDPRDSLREWLMTQPNHRASHAYDAWAHEQNRSLPPRESPHMSASGIANALVTSFAVAVREAQRALAGHVPLTEADHLATESLATGPHRLVTLLGAGLLLGYAKSHMEGLRTEEGFPPVAATLGRRRLWLASDIEAYRDGKPISTKPNELAGIVLSPVELAQRLGISHGFLHRAIKAKRLSIPPPDGYVGTSPWWDAQRFEHWLNERGETQAAE